METTQLHQKIDERVRGFRNYYNFKNTRALLGFFLESEYPVERYPASKRLPDQLPLAPEDFNPEDYLEDCDRLFELHEQAGGDFIWSASPFWGVPWLEAALGCQIYKNSSTGSLHNKQHPDFIKNPVVPDFDRSNPWIARALDFTRVIAKHSAGRYPLATPRLRGIADLLSALYGNEAFIFKFIESPDEVKKVCEKLTDFWINFAKAVLFEIPLFHGGVGSFYYNMWAPSDSVWHQEDAAALLSPNLYEEFILPCDIKIAESFNGCFMHMHPVGFYPYKQLLDSPMTCLELHIDAGGPDAEKLNTVHREILSKKPLLIWGQLTDKDLDCIFNKLSPQGLAVNVAVESIEQAQQIWNKYTG
jgi:hypothetical protein